jgi:hypothetical protein
MSIDEKGRIIFESPEEHQEEINPEYQFIYWVDAFGAQSVLPEGIEKPKDLYYWRGDRLQHYKELFEKMKDLVAKNNLIEIINPYSKEKITVSDFINKIEKSIEFSESIK